ncbi:MAG: hypothetical protein ACRDL4_16030 [Thermoleophilaceae bacterium]
MSSMRFAALAVACLALFVALGGPSHAARLIGAGQIKKSAVRSKHVKDNNLRSKDIRNNNLRGRDIRNGSLKGADVDESSLDLPPGPTGPQGPAGPQGLAGPPGEPATRLFAVVDNAHNSVVRGSGVTGFDQGVADNGRVDIAFDRDLSQCAYLVSIGDIGAAAPGAPAGGARIEELIAGNVMRVVTFDTTTGTSVELPFHVAVFC